MSDTVSSVNPLLSIDTDFRSYLNAYTRSFQNHVIDGQLDYAIDSDFAVRQKLIGLSGWGKLSKAINGTDISAEAKHLFLKCEQAGALKYPEIYDVLKQCSERLELNLPIVLLRKDYEKPLIYSIASDLIEPSIVITKTLFDMCSKEELELLIGSECGRIQNNHCVYNWAFTYLNYNKDAYKPSERSYKGAVNSQIVGALISCGLLKKGYTDFYGRKQENTDAEKLMQLSAANHTTAARSLRPAASLTDLERKIVASAEYLTCDSLFTWRTDLEAADSHTCTGQICDVRSNIILAGGQ